MGGSGGGFGGDRSIEQLQRQIDEHGLNNAQEFEAELQQEFATLLSSYNERNSEEIAEHLQNIKEILREEIASSFDTLFGGSVAKHTYVDGISDIDSMLIISGSLANKDPKAIINKIAETLRAGLNDQVDVSVGSVAVTVTYPSGTQIQLVPTIEKDGKFNVPAWERNGWSTIDPQQFKDGLTKRNKECAGRLIPTLKLAKAVNATLPDAARMSGYHIESLGVAAFRGYDGERTTVRMLPHFFKRASELVLSPMVDRTGQSVHVDENLGPAVSAERMALSHMLARIHQRMINASAAKSRGRWKEIMGEQ